MVYWLTYPWSQSIETIETIEFSKEVKAGTEVETRKGAAYWHALWDIHLVCWSLGQD